MEDIWYVRLMQLAGFIWPLITLVLLAGSTLLFLSDRRIHSLCLIIGYSIHLFSGVWSQFFAPRMYQEDEMMKVLTLNQGLMLIGGGLVAFGLFSYGLIAYRKVKLSRLDHETAP